MKTQARTRPAEPRRAWPRLLAGAALWLAAGAAQAALQLDELMALLAQTRSAEARFYEQRFVRGLDAPLVSTGTMSFSAPDRFVRSTQAPRPESMSVVGGNVTLTRSGRSRTMAVDAMPELQAVVEAIRGTLSGNASSLKQHFRATTGGSVEQWTLELKPLEPRLQGLLGSIRLAGSRSQLRRVEMLMTDGDHSVMTIETLAVNLPASAPGATRP